MNVIEETDQSISEQCVVLCTLHFTFPNSVRATYQEETFYIF